MKNPEQIQALLDAKNVEKINLQKMLKDSNVDRDMINKDIRYLDKEIDILKWVLHA